MGLMEGEELSHTFNILCVQTWSSLGNNYWIHIYFKNCYQNYPCDKFYLCHLFFFVKISGFFFPLVWECGLCVCAIHMPVCMWRPEQGCPISWSIVICRCLILLRWSLTPNVEIGWWSLSPTQQFCLCLPSHLYLPCWDYRAVCGH